MNLSKFCFGNTSQRKALILKNDDFLEIFIPSVGLFSRFTIISLLFLIFPVYLINFFALSLPNFNIKFIIPVFVFNSIISVVTIGVILLSEFTQKRLSITRQTITWAYEIFGIKLKDPFPASLGGGIRIARTQHTWNRHFVEIWAGKRVYEFSTSEFSAFALSNPELDFIARELSDWLELTIVQEL